MCFGAWEPHSKPVLVNAGTRARGARLPITPLWVGHHPRGFRRMRGDGERSRRGSIRAPSGYSGTALASFGARWSYRLDHGVPRTQTRSRTLVSCTSTRRTSRRLFTKM